MLTPKLVNIIENKDNLLKIIYLLSYTTKVVYTINVV